MELVRASVFLRRHRPRSAVEHHVIEQLILEELGEVVAGDEGPSDQPMTPGTGVGTTGRPSTFCCNLRRQALRSARRARAPPSGSAPIILRERARPAPSPPWLFGGAPMPITSASATWSASSQHELAGRRSRSVALGDRDHRPTAVRGRRAGTNRYVGVRPGDELGADAVGVDGRGRECRDGDLRPGRRASPRSVVLWHRGRRAAVALVGQARRCRSPAHGASPRPRSRWRPASASSRRRCRRAAWSLGPAQPPARGRRRPRCRAAVKLCALAPGAGHAVPLPGREVGGAPGESGEVRRRAQAIRRFSRAGAASRSHEGR